VRVQKRYRQGQILKLISGDSISSQDQLRSRLARHGLRVTQATLSRDLRELKLVKTAQGYRSRPAIAEEAGPFDSAPLDSARGRQGGPPPFTRALREFLLDLRPAQNLLVLKTPPGGAQPLAAAVDAERWKEVVGTVAGDDTVLIISSSPKAREILQKRIQELLR